MLCKFLRLDFIFLQFVFAIFSQDIWQIVLNCRRVRGRSYSAHGGREERRTASGILGGDEEVRWRIRKDSLPWNQKGKETRFHISLQSPSCQFDPQVRASWPGVQLGARFPRLVDKKQNKVSQVVFKKKRFPRLKLEPARFSGGCHLQSTLSTSSTWSPREKANKPR